MTVSYSLVKVRQLAEVNAWQAYYLARDLGVKGAKLDKLRNAANKASLIARKAEGEK